MANTQDESSSDLEMETSPRCIEYPAENNKEEEEAPVGNAIAIIRQDTNEQEPREIAQQQTTFEALCTQLPTHIKIEELHFEYQ